MTMTLTLTLSILGQILYAGQKEIHLTHKECIKRIIDDNTELQNALFEKLISQEELKEVLGDFDPTVYVSVLNRDSEAPSSNLVEGNHAKRFDYNLSLSKKFITGTQLSLDFDNYRYWTDSSYETLNPSYKSSLGIGFTQPLFENIFGLSDRLEIKSSKKKIDMEAWNYLHKLNLLVYDASLKYYELLLLHKKKEILYENLHLNEKLLKTNQERYKLGLATKVEVIETRSYIIDNYTEITKTNDLINGIEKELFYMMNLPMTIDEKARIIPEERLSILQNTPERVRDELFLWEFRCDIQAKEAELKQINLEIKKYHSENLPDLNLIGNIAKNGIGATYGDDLEYLQDEQRISWKIGLDLTIPLGLRTEKGRLLQQVNKQKQIKNELDSLKKQALIEYHSVLRSFRFIKEQLKLSEKQIELTKRKMDYEKHQYKIGKSTNLDVLEMQKKHLDIKLNNIDIMYQYNAMIFNSYLNQGTIAEKYTRYEYNK